MIDSLFVDIPETKQKVLHQSDVLVGTIKQRHFEANVHGIKVGLIANIPATGDETFFYFATDELKLYAWNNSTLAWVSVTLS